MKDKIYLLVAIINAIYGALLLLSLSLDTPGFLIVLTIGLLLTALGITGFVFWLKYIISANRDNTAESTALKNWFGLVKSFDTVLVIGLLFRFLVVQPYIVEGSSMESSFHDKEVLLVDKVTYRLRDPQRGDVIVFKAPKTPGDEYIKRVIAVPGETVVITQNKVFVNGKLLDEKYINDSTTTSEKILRQTLQPNEYFVMGDNRNNSSDSRDWGAVPEVNIVGRALVVLFPLENKGIIKNPKTPIIEDKTLKELTSNFLSLPRR